MMRFARALFLFATNAEGNLHVEEKETKHPMLTKLLKPTNETSVAPKPSPPVQPKVPKVWCKNNLMTDLTNLAWTRKGQKQVNFSSRVFLV